jgi:peptidoglycan hydrolase-like protein with peptidoglycan-binding domain
VPRDTGIAQRLRNFGLTVVEVNGWQTRGSDAFNPRGSVDHHTAGPRRGNAPSLNVCINGRADLPGPLCNVLVGRDGTCYVVAAGRANHAGTGGWGGLSGNASVYGVERENVGDGSEPWTLQQYDTAARVHAALVSAAGGRADLVCGHKEWAPRRKVDAWGVDGNVMRQLVRDRLGRPAPAPTPANALQAIHAAAKARPTLREGATGAWVKDLQAGLNAVVGRPVVPVTGRFDGTTARWVRQFQKDRTIPPTGVVGTTTWEQLIAARLVAGK